MEYIVELEFDDQKATQEEMNEILAVTDGYFEDENIPCILKTNTARVYVKSREDQYSFAKVWVPLIMMRKENKVINKLKRATWENGMEKNDLMTDFFFKE